MGDLGEAAGQSAVVVEVILVRKINLISPQYVISRKIDEDSTDGECKPIVWQWRLGLSILSGNDYFTQLPSLGWL